MKRSGAALPPTVETLARDVRPADPDGSLTRRVQARLDSLAKPRGSLGRLESLALRLAVAQGNERPRSRRKTVLVFAGDHGICEEGVSAFPAEVTAQLCYAYAAGGGVVNALARGNGAEVVAVDVGVDHDFEGTPGIRHRKVRRRTGNFARGPAMAREEVERAMLAGAESVRELEELDILAVGEAGIGNTTVSAALATLLTGADPAEMVGRGTGVGEETLRRKTDLVRRAVEQVEPGADPVALLQSVGGFEFAALAGAVLAAAARRVPVVLDGFATGAAALLALRIAPAAAGYLIASHRSAERGHARVLSALGLEPLLEWDLRLGEGSGAALALPLVDAACTLLTGVATFEEAGVEPRFDERGVR